MNRRHLWIVVAAGLVFALIFGVRETASGLEPLTTAPASNRKTL